VRFPGKFDVLVGLHFTCRLKITFSSYSEYPYFVCTTKAAFWEDRERVKSSHNHTLLPLGHEDGRLQKCCKKIAKDEIERTLDFQVINVSLRFINEKCEIIIKTSLLTTAGSQSGTGVACR